MFDRDIFIDDMLGSEYDDELGDVETFGWYGLVKGFSKNNIKRARKLAADMGVDYDDLEIEEGVGGIMHIDSQGYHAFDGYHNLERLISAWENLVEEHRIFLGPSDDDVIAADYSGPFFYGGKKIADTPDELKSWMDQNKYWPSIWLEEERGGYREISGDDLEY